MEAGDFQRFKELMLAMSKIFGSELDSVMLDVYWLSMRSWPMDSFREAAGHLMANAKFMPRPADFNQLRKAAKPTDGEAWAEAIKRCVHWRTGKAWGDVIERAVAAVGGYRALAMADTETALPHIERRFKEAYSQLDEVETVRAALPDVTQQPRISARDGSMKQLVSPFPLGQSLPSKS